MSTKSDVMIHAGAAVERNKKCHEAFDAKVEILRQKGHQFWIIN